MKKGYSIRDIVSWRPCAEYPAERGYIMFGNDPVTIERALEAKYDKVGDILWLILREEFLTKAELRKIMKWCKNNVLVEDSESWRNFTLNHVPEMDPPNAIRAMIGSAREWGMVEFAGWAVVDYIRKIVAGRKK